MIALVALLGSNANRTNVDLVAAWRELGIEAELIAPREARRRLRAGDVALARLDVLPTLDGVEPGLLELLLLERGGEIRIWNGTAALLGAHDKLLTARLLAESGVPHPRTLHVRRGAEIPSVEPPLAVKPRFGSWGRDVFRCESRADLERVLDAVRERPWFHRHGALVQELVAPQGHDLRLLVAGGRVVGAVQRVAAPGEWRTNVSLGGSLRPAFPQPEVCELGVAAALAIGADFVGVDLLPLPGGGYTVLELNGAVEFDGRYSLPGGDVYTEVAAAVGVAAVPREAQPVPA